MADEAAKQDPNSVPVLLGVTSGGEIRQVLVDSTGRLIISLEQILLADNEILYLGTDSDVQHVFDTTDPNAEAYKIGLPDPSATVVPILHLGLASDIIGVDLAVGNGETRPQLYIWNDGVTKYAKMGWGTNYFEFSSGSSAQQYYFGPTLNTNQIIVGNDSQFALGGTSSFSLKRNVVFGDNDIRLGLGTEPLVISTYNNVNNDFTKGVVTRPTEYLTSETLFTTAKDEWVKREFDTNDFLTTLGKGDMRLLFDYANDAALNFRIAEADVTAASGATVTASSLIPDGALLVGVATRVTTALGTSNGTTGYQVGDGSDADRWGAITGTATTTSSDNTDATASFFGTFTSASDVVLTAVGGNFDGTGVIKVTALYLDITAPSAT